jgi:SAM-dependent methyltransferase
MTVWAAGQSFDGVAPTYDSEFTQTRLARWLRASVRAYLAEAFQPGDRVLDLGCGTGEDALWLARCGVHVTATDISQAMLVIAQRKAAAAGLAHLVDFAAVDLAAPPFASDNPQFRYSAIPHSRIPRFSGAFSNFGPLNCLRDRRPLVRALAHWIEPGGQVVLVVMGPVCPWEIGWHLLHGQPRPALRRWRGGGQAHVGHGQTIRVWYPSPRTLEAEFAPYFEVRKLAGIGSLLPPSYLSDLVERRPGLFGHLARADRRVGAAWPWWWLSDHYLVHMQRR